MKWVYYTFKRIFVDASARRTNWLFSKTVFTPSSKLVRPFCRSNVTDLERFPTRPRRLTLSASLNTRLITAIFFKATRKSSYETIHNMCFALVIACMFKSDENAWVVRAPFFILKYYITKNGFVDFAVHRDFSIFLEICQGIRFEELSVLFGFPMRKHTPRKNRCVFTDPPVDRGKRSTNDRRKSISNELIQQTYFHQAGAK